MWRRAAFPLSLAAAAAAAALAASSLSAAPVVREQLAPIFPGGPNYGIGCSISHRSNDDPIVFPGQPGRSHNHTFIGNTTVNAWSTPASLRGGETSCSDAGDSSGYWVPSLFVDRQAVLPIAAIVFYVKRSNARPATLPRGLVMIQATAPHAARNPRASSRGTAVTLVQSRPFPASLRAGHTRCSSSGSRSRTAGTVEPWTAATTSGT